MLTASYVPSARLEYILNVIIYIMYICSYIAMYITYLSTSSYIAMCIKLLADYITRTLVEAVGHVLSV